MRFNGVTFVLAALLSAALLAQSPVPPPVMPPAAGGVLKTVKDRVSYGIGRSVSGNFKGLDVDLRLLMQGIADALTGKPDLQTDDEFQQAVKALQQETAAKMLADGKAFLANNARAPGVKVTPSGLQYQVIKPGTGARPTAQNRVKAHYKGTFLDGKTFDNSYDRMEPAVFPLDGVIRGWTEGVPLMQVGAKYKFWIPSDLAYGHRGRPSIPPNSTLVFEIELFEVLPGVRLHQGTLLAPHNDQ
jgi:FKBP-type peptidyl-prolyl cis-trans isomerase